LDLAEDLVELIDFPYLESHLINATYTILSDHFRLTSLSEYK